MAAVTDLTFAQLNDALKQLLGTDPDTEIIIAGTGGILNVNISAILKQQTTVNTSTGVIKVLTVLLDAARIAQEAANTGKVTGEKLTAFPVPTTGTPNNGAVPITRTIAARALLSSATQIVGTNA